jgi:hypothetical protein
MNQPINASTPEVSVINPDGTVSSEALTLREISIFEAVDRALRTDPKFTSSYPDAVLERIESLRAMPETSSGRAYLRYRFATGVTEFWGRVSNRARINFRSGIVDVILEPAPSAPPNSSTTDLAPKTDKT